MALRLLAARHRVLEGHGRRMARRSVRGLSSEALWPDGTAKRFRGKAPKAAVVSRRIAGGLEELDQLREPLQGLIGRAEPRAEVLLGGG